MAAEAWRDQAKRGWVRQSEHGRAWLGLARLGSQGKAGPCTEWPGEARRSSQDKGMADDKDKDEDKTEKVKEILKKDAKGGSQSTDPKALKKIQKRTKKPGKS